MRSGTEIAVGVACCTIGIMLDVFVFETRLSSAAQDFVAEDVLLLNDPYRGLGTGASGRDITLDFGFVLFCRTSFGRRGFRPQREAR